MIEELVPAGVVHAEAFGDLGEARLFPEEEAVVAGTGPERRGEFATARRLAHDALARLGVPPAPLLPGPHGAPLWPAGVVGSITHCAGYRAVVVAERAAVVTLGVDAEPDEPLPAGVLRRIATPGERDRTLRLLEERPGPRWDRLLFSAKESVFKAWYSLTGRGLRFQDAVVALAEDGGRFGARLPAPGPESAGARRPAAFRGRWMSRHGLLVTAVVLTVRDARADRDADVGGDVGAGGKAGRRRG